MKKNILIVALLVLGLNATGQTKLDGRGMFVMGHFLPGVEQTFSEGKLWIGIPLMAGTVGCVGAAVGEQVKIHNYKIKMDADPFNAPFYEERIEKAIKGRNISLCCLGAVELVNIITLWIGANSPVNLAYFPETDAVGVTYAVKF